MKSFSKGPLIVFILLLPLLLGASSGDEHEAMYNLAKSAMRASRLSQAQTLFEQLFASQNPIHRREIMMSLGEIYLINRSTTDLAALAEQAMMEFPESAYAHAGSAAAWALKAQQSSNNFHKLNQATNALHDADKALHLDGDCALALFIKGMVIYHMPEFLGHLSDAEHYFREVLTSLDVNRERIMLPTYYFLALTLRRLRRTKSAIMILERGLLRYPQHKGMRKILRHYQHDFAKHQKRHQYIYTP
jgi:tetratricopeptide (TPR) repeat protein